LSFKIILIQKSQISISKKCLNLFEFENVFDLDLDLDFKFKSAAKIFQKHFHFLLAAQNHFWHVFPSSPSATLGFFSFFQPCQPTWPCGLHGPLRPSPPRVHPLPPVMPNPPPMAEAVTLCRRSAPLPAHLPRGPPVMENQPAPLSPSHPGPFLFVFPSSPSNN
jgi:hypothetical protein